MLRSAEARLTLKRHMSVGDGNAALERHGLALHETQQDLEEDDENLANLRRQGEENDWEKAFTGSNRIPVKISSSITDFKHQKAENVVYAAGEVCLLYVLGPFSAPAFLWLVTTPSLLPRCKISVPMLLAAQTRRFSSHLPVELLTAALPALVLGGFSISLRQVVA